MLNCVNRSLNNVFFTKTILCQTQRKLNPLILSGASGAGKGTLFEMLKSRNPKLFELSVSCTTRKPRVGEEHGKSYYFISHDEFKNEIGKDSFVEHCFVHGNYYGTLTSQVSTIINNGKICVLDIDVQGAEQIHKKFPHWNYVFINVPSIEVLEHRLRVRQTDSEEQIQIRLKNSTKELEAKKRLGFYYEIMNNTKEQAYTDLLSYLKTKYSGIKIN